MNGLWRHFIRYQLPALLWAVVIFVASSIPSSRLPKFALTLNDRFVHGAIFFIFGLLVYRALARRIPVERIDRMRLLISVSAVILYGISDEFHQGFVPGRSFDVRDTLADAAGGICSAIVIYLHAIRKRQPQS